MVGLAIGELCLPVAVARSIGGDANARVNNASVVTRIDVYGNSILICGDIEKEAWAAIINNTGDYGRLWRPFLSNIDILIAPHHGHRSGYSAELMNSAQPAVVLVSVGDSGSQRGQSVLTVTSPQNGLLATRRMAISAQGGIGISKSIFIRPFSLDLAIRVRLTGLLGKRAVR